MPEPPQAIIVSSRVPAFSVSDSIDVHSLLFPSADSESTNVNNNKTALIDPLTNSTVSYGLLRTRIDGCVRALYSIQFQKWDVVGIYAANHIEYPVAVHGVLKAGGTVTLANPTYTASELAFQLKDAGAKFLITTVDLLAPALVAAKEAGIDMSRVFLFSPSRNDTSATEKQTPVETVGSFKYIMDLVEKGIRDNQRLGQTLCVSFTKNELATRPAYLCYSSGTTGRSKGVETTHRNMVSNILQFYHHQKHFDEIVPNDTWVGVLPFYHIYGLALALHTSFYMKNSVVVVPKFELESFLTYLSRYSVGIAHIVPPIAVAFAKHPIVDTFKFPALRCLFSGAAPLGGDVADLIQKRLGVPIIQGYGMTETTPIATLCVASKPVNGSSGFLVPNMQARFVSPMTGQDVPHGQEGELWLKGPNVMKGYHNNDKATRETIDGEGWLRTGDIGYVDAEGNFFIVDRIKELIKYKGLQVAPAELEAYLLTHPSVADAAVIPRPDERAGELPRAYIVLKPGKQATEKEIQTFIESKVSQHKRLRGGVAFIDAIPKSASGKILRRVLRDREKDERTKAMMPSKL